MMVQPWSTLGPKGAALVVHRDRRVGETTTAEVIPNHPPCLPEAHVEAWTGLGFPRHPDVVVRLCVRCWQVFEVADRGD
jgi:hypothetical protein